MSVKRKLCIRGKGYNAGINRALELHLKHYRRDVVDADWLIDHPVHIQHGKYTPAGSNRNLKKENY